jgi:hypothetical protein
MIEQEFIMLIMNCVKYEKKALFQKMTWIKLIPPYLRYYHVIGDEKMETTYRFDEDNHVLRVKTKDDYNSLPNKVITSYQAVNETFNFKYLFKTDDDQKMSNLRFFDTISQMLLTKQPKSHYGGYIVDVPKPYLSGYHNIHPELPKNLPIYQTKYCSGRFYFLSREAIENLISKRDKIKDEFLEDYAIGLNLDPIYKTHIFNIYTNKYFTDIEL